MHSSIQDSIRQVFAAFLKQFSGLSFQFLLVNQYSFMLKIVFIRLNLVTNEDLLLQIRYA